MQRQIDQQHRHQSAHMVPLSRPPQQRNDNLSILSEVSRQPKGAEWLWHPKVVLLYRMVLQSRESNSTSREAAVGALQNITAGEARVRFLGSHTGVQILNDSFLH